MKSVRKMDKTGHLCNKEQLNINELAIAFTSVYH